MYVLSIDKEICNNCGDCESHLPGIMENVEAFGTILISDANLFQHSLNITKALQACEGEALSLRGYDEEETK